eukprot:COSAG01_NODE_29368_length_639_cov_1.588889_2_plen_71_part_00
MLTWMCGGMWMWVGGGMWACGGAWGQVRNARNAQSLTPADRRYEELVQELTVLLAQVRATAMPGWRGCLC